MNDDAVHQLNRGDAIASKLCSYRNGVSVGSCKRNANARLMLIVVGAKLARDER
jgi:hypothetical protein